MAVTATFENRLVTWLLSSTAVTRPTAWYIGLHTGTPAADGSTNELSGNGYARQPITPSIASNVASNPAIVTFGPNTTTGWGTVTYASLWDAVTGGNCIALSAVATPTTYAVGDSATFAIGAFTFTVT